MGTCISRPKKVDRRKNPQNLYLQHPQSSNCEAIPNDSQVMITTNNSHNNVIPFPYFQPKWTINKNKQGIKSIDMSKIIAKSGNNNKDWINNYLNWRYYSYSQMQVKKLFTTKPYFIEQIENKQWVKVPTLQGLLFSSYQTSKIKLCPQFEFLDASLNFNNQLEQDSVLMANQANTPAYHIFQNHNNEIIVDLLAESERVKILFNALKDCKKNNLTKNCLFNGILFRSQNKNINNPQNKRHVNMKFNDVMEIFDEKIQGIQFTDQIICYINPLLRQGLKNQGKSIRKLNYSTYLQLKCELQYQNLDIVQLFNPDLIMTGSKCQPICVYILLFCLKVVMFNNQTLKQIPLLFLNQFIKMVSQQKNILSKVFNVMAFCYALILPHYYDLSKIYDPELVRNCCRNVLQISAVNSHILVDAYLIQFSVEIDQKIVPIRQNPLIQPSQPLKYRGLITLQLNKRLINSLKTQMDRHILLLLKQVSSQVLQPKQTSINIKKIIQGWQQQSLKIISIILEIKTLTKTSRLKSLMDLAKDYYSPNMFIIFQYLLGIKIFMFVVIAQIGVDILVISPTLLARDASMIRNIKKDWNQIIQDFMSNTAFNYCSGELSITILTLDALVKMLDLNQNLQQTKQNLKKCMEIWFRIYRDPRAKYKPFLPNSWIVYIIDVLIKVKIKNLTDNYSTQSIFYLQNILECFYANGDVLEFGNPSHIQWIFANIPIRNISGIFYNKIDLIAAPSPDDKSGFLMRTGSSLIQSPGDLSSKSNFSQTISNKNSVISRNRRIRYGNIQIPQFSQCKALRNGVYAWGKGVNCIPLIYPFAKNLDVLKISCGNYHVVLATSIGVFGWGENASGQLGQPSKQPIRTIKMILPKIIINSDYVSLSCGNQHTAILFKYQTLIMFGQSQCGIISGNGHKFDYVSCGGLHTLGIKNGRVYSWGRGEGGQLGHKTSQLKTKVKEQSTDFYLDQPKMIQNLPLIVKSVCGDAHSILLTQQGDVYVFGFSYQGQLGLGITGDNDLFQIFQPVKLNFNLKNKNIKIVDIFAGSTFTFFKTSQGQIYSCGLNDCNQLGMQQMMKVFHKKKYLGQQKKVVFDIMQTNQRKLGQAQFSRPNKIQIFNSQTKVKEIFCGENHCLASVEYMSKNKMVMGWGLNKQLQISSEFPHDSIKPRTIDNIYDFNFESLCCGSNCSYGYIRHQNRLTLHQLQQNIQILIKNNLKYTKAPFIDGKEKTIVRG